jgi:hypothetical protein
MRVTIPKEIKENLEQLTSVMINLDDVATPGRVIPQILPIAYVAQNDYAEVLDYLWQSCSYIRYIVKYKDGTESIISFDSKEKAAYTQTANRSEREVHGFDEINPREMLGWYFGRPPREYSYSKANIVNGEFLDALDSCRLIKGIELPATGVFRLKNGVVSSRGLVYSYDLRQRYLELSRFSSLDEVNKDEAELKIYLGKKLDRLCPNTSARYYKGRALNLYTFFSNYNFCHGFLDVCALLSSCYSVGIDFKEFDWFVVPENNFSLTQGLFDRLGIDKTKKLVTGEIKVEDKVQARDYSLMFDELVTPSFDGFCGYYAPHAFDFIRYLYADELTALGKRRKIYLSREGSVRGVSNEQDLIELLKKYGFDVVNSSTQANIPELMSNASVIIGAHGAAMANCVFCSPGARLIDLLPAGYPYPYYMSLADSVGLEYTAFVCKSKGKGAATKADFMVDIPRLKVFLDQTL